MDAKTIRSIAQVAAAEVMTAMGVTSGEISRHRAEAVYGRWFRDAEASGRLHPTRVGVGRTGTKWYSVSAILALRAEDMQAAETQLNNI